MSWRHARWAAAILAALVYLNTLGASFTLDDVEIVGANPLTRSLTNVPEIFRTDYWGAWEYADHTLYRPFTVTTYAIQHALHGTSPGGYHVVNVLLHAVVTLLLGLLVRDLFGSERLAAVAALLFAVHPVHTEAVAGVVGRAEVLALGGTLLCVLAYLRATRMKGSGRIAWAVVSVAAYFAGATSKETGILAPAVVLLAEAFLPRHRRFLRGQGRSVALFAAYVGTAALVLFLRAAAVSGRSVHETFAGATDLQRVATALRVALEYVGQLIAPVRLSADYPPASTPIASGLTEPAVLVAVLLVGAAATYLFRARSRIPAAAWGFAFFLLALLPVSNLLFAIGVVKAERLLYAPSAGFLVMVAALVDPLLERRRTRIAAVGVLSVVVLALGVLTWTRNEVWRDDCTLAAATLRTTPDSPVFLTRMATCLMEAGRPDEARARLRRALEIRPGFPTALLFLGVLEREAGNLERAVEPLRELLAREPRHAEALEHLAWVYYRLDRLPEAADAFERLRAIRPGEPYAYSYLIIVYARMRDLPRAEETARQALARFPHDENIRKNVEVLRQLASEDEGGATP